MYEQECSRYALLGPPCIVDTGTADHTKLDLLVLAQKSACTCQLVMMGVLETASVVGEGANEGWQPTLPGTPLTTVMSAAASEERQSECRKVSCCAIARFTTGVDE